jgi:hypothetical protein
VKKLFVAVLAGVLSLAAPDNDVAATAGETLGGALIQNDGRWNGSWKPLDDFSSVKVPAASAAIIRFAAN